MTSQKANKTKISLAADSAHATLGENNFETTILLRWGEQVVYLCSQIQQQASSISTVLSMKHSHVVESAQTQFHLTWSCKYLDGKNCPSSDARTEKLTFKTFLVTSVSLCTLKMKTFCRDGKLRSRVIFCNFNKSFDFVFCSRFWVDRQKVVGFSSGKLELSVTHRQVCVQLVVEHATEHGSGHTPFLFFRQHNGHRIL